MQALIPSQTCNAPLCCTSPPPRAFPISQLLSGKHYQDIQDEGSALQALPAS